MRFATVASWLGVLTGVWTPIPSYLGGVCPGGHCIVASQGGAATLVLAIFLILVSFVCMVGPRQLFYVTAILALLIGGSVVFYSSISLGNTITLVLAAVVFVVAMVAARREGRVSEQSHPMNLPIFG